MSATQHWFRVCGVRRVADVIPAGGLMCRTNPEAGCGFRPGWGGRLSDLRSSPRRRLSLQLLHSADLPEVFTLAATLPGKRRGNGQEVMFPNSICYPMERPFSAAEVGGSGEIFAKSSS